MSIVKPNTLKGRISGVAVALCLFLQPFVVFLNSRPARAESTEVETKPAEPPPVAPPQIPSASPDVDNALSKLLTPENVSPAAAGGRHDHSHGSGCPFKIGHDLGDDSNTSDTPVVASQGMPGASQSGCPCHAGNKGDPVDITTGEFIDAETDLYIPCRGFPIEIKRTYRSRQEYTSPWGYNWFFKYDSNIQKTANNSYSVLELDGRREEYTYNGTTYTSPEMHYDVLVPQGDGSVKLTKKDGSYQLYDNLGRLAALVDRFGNQLTMGYDPAGKFAISGTSGFFKTPMSAVIARAYRLTTITDSYGRQVTISYWDSTSGAKTGRVQAVTDYIGRQVKYDYDTNGNLISVTSPVTSDYPSGKTTKYTYSSGSADQNLNHNLLTITAPNEVANGGVAYLVNQYDAADRVVKQTFGNGTFTFTYQSTFPDGKTQTATFLDRNNNQTDYTCSQTGNILQEIKYTSTGNYTTKYTYNSLDELSTVTYPLGNGVAYTYDSLGNVNVIRSKANMVLPDGAGDLVTYMEYEPRFNQLKRSVDPAGNVWINYFDYEEAHALTAPGANGLDWTYNATTAGLGDLNGDGTTAQAIGVVVKRQFLGPNDGPANTNTTNDGVRLGQPALQTIQSKYIYNSFGQITSTIDPQGIVTQYDYYPQNDPDGGTTTITGQTNTNPTGYLKDTITDSGTGGLNLQTSYSYDRVGNVTALTNPRGYKTTFTVNQLNQVTQVDSPTVTLSGGKTAVYETQLIYDWNNNLSKKRVHNLDETGAVVTAHAWIETAYTYDLLDNLLSITQDIGPDPNNAGAILRRTMRYEYDNNENLILAVQPEGNSVQYVYDNRNLIHQVIRDPYLGVGSINAVTTQNFDGNMNVTSISNPNNHSASFSYDGFDRLSTVTDALNNTATRTYDNNSNTLTVTARNATGTVLAFTRTDFDELNRPYAVHRWVSGATDQTGVYVNSSIVFDPDSRVSTATDTNNHSAQFAFDKASRIALITDALGNTIQPTYDANSNVLKTVTSEMQAGGPKTFTATAAFDEIDRIVSTRDQGPDGIYNNTDDRIASVSYDSRGNATTATDPKGIVTKMVFDGRSRMTLLRHDVNGKNIQTQFAYDLNSRLTQYTGIRNNADGIAQYHTTTYTYDNLNRLAKTIFADGTSTSQSYDGVGNITSYTDQYNSSVSYLYDSLERLTSFTISRAGGVVGTQARTYGYDGLSRVTSATDNNDPADPNGFSECDYTYDGLSRILTESQKYGPSAAPTVNKTITYSYTNGSADRLNLNHVTYPDGTAIQYGRDALDRITNVYYGANTTNTLAAYTYAGLGRTASIQNYTGTSAPVAIGSLSVAYDGVKRAVSVHNQLASGVLLASFDYGFDKADNRVYAKFLHAANTGEIYRYDTSYRVTEAYYSASAGDIASAAAAVAAGNDPAAPSAYANKTLYSLDNLGNRSSVTTAGVNGANPVTTTYTSSQATNDYKMNRITSVGATAETYDANGNQTSDGTYNYTYDVFNRMVTVTRKSDSAAIATYRYDALGRRIRKTVTNSGALNGTTHYIYDGSMTLEEYAVTNPGATETLAENARYVNGRTIDERICMERNNVASIVGTGTNADFQRFYYYTDGLGSVRAVTWLQPGTNNEQLVERANYDIYGKATFTNWGADRTFGTGDDTTSSTSLVGNPFLFTGQRYDAETGNYYYRARYYSPSTGRFLSQDPAGYIDGSNMYQYCSSSPLSYTDPTGLSKHQGGRYGQWTHPGTSLIEANLRETASNEDLEWLDAQAQANHDLSAQGYINWEQGRRRFEIAEHEITYAKVARYQADKNITVGDVAEAVWDKTKQPYVTGWNHVVHPIDSFNNDVKSFNRTVDYFLAPDTGPRAFAGMLPIWGSILHADDVGTNWNVSSNVENVSGVMDLSQRIVSDAVTVGGAISGFLPEAGGKMCPGDTCFVAGTMVLTGEGKRSIEDIHVGDRVLTAPDDKQDSSTTVDPSSFRLVKMRMQNSEASWDVMEIYAIRSLKDIEKYGWKVGRNAYVLFAEMKIAGQARIDEILPCPKLKDGPGRVVLLTISHFNGVVLQFKLSGVDKVLEPTAFHKLFSATAGTWIEAGSIKVGDELVTRTGKAKVLEIRPKPGLFRVYNIEVESDHCYYVSDAEVLSHNTCPKPIGPLMEDGRFSLSDPVSSDLAPGGGLQAHEDAGGHLLDRHIGKTDGDLQARLSAQRNIPAASTFGTRAEAEAAVSAAMDANQGAIANWVGSGANGKFPIEAPFSGGRVFLRGATTSAPGTGVRVVLQGNGTGGYFILTGFPIP